MSGMRYRAGPSLLAPSGLTQYRIVPSAGRDNPLTHCQMVGPSSHSRAAYIPTMLALGHRLFPRRWFPRRHSQRRRLVLCAGDEAKGETTAVSDKFMLLDTSLGNIWFRLRPDSAPLTVQHVCRLVNAGLYDGCYFYRSDFVLQWGLWLPDESEVKNPFPDIAENEINTGEFISNKRGTVSVAHGIGANGNSDLFINLDHNDYLDTMSMGFAVWAVVEDPGSLKVADALASAVCEGKKPVIYQARTTKRTKQMQTCRQKFPMAQLMGRSYDEFCKAHAPLPAVPYHLKESGE